jgi:cellulase/cellobiase CelA1
MSLTLKEVPDTRQVIGPSMQEVQFVLVLDTSYPTGGYIITAAKVGLLKLYGAWLIGWNATTVTAADLWAFTVAQTSAPLASVTQVALQAFNAVPLVEETAAHSFAGCVLTAMFRGY